MIYKPEVGKFKDVSVYYESGTYYLFSMYGEVKDAYDSVWLAVSQDGVHFRGVGPVIEHAPFPIWAMNVHKTDAGYVLNHGSFTPEGVQGVIKLWFSQDLYHWEYAGEEYDLLPPPGVENARLDCMPVLETEEDGRRVYYGYPTSPWPLWRSEDGIRWTALPRENFFDWKGFPKTLMRSWEGDFEVCGCVRLGEKYYYLGGWFNYLGERGYRVHVLTADNPKGPFSPDTQTYRLSGNSHRWISMWARLCRGDGELLASSYMNEGYSYECGETWLPPIKRVDTDAHGHMRLYWWKNNEELKGERLSTEWSEAEVSAPEHSAVGPAMELAVCSQERMPLPFDKGVFIEFEWMANSEDLHSTAPWAGIFLEEDNSGGTAIWCGLSGGAQIGYQAVDRESAAAKPFGFRAEDSLGAMTAAATRLERGRWHKVRLLVRRGMFEWYLDDMLAQTFNTSREFEGIGRTPTAVRFLARDGRVQVRNLRVWQMKL